MDRQLTIFPSEFRGVREPQKSVSLKSKPCNITIRAQSNCTHLNTQVPIAKEDVFKPAAPC